MNAMTLINRILAAGTAVWLLAATLPAMNSEVITPFEGFVMTPLIMMLAALVGVACNAALNRLQLQVQYEMKQLARPQAQNAACRCEAGTCLQHAA